MRVDEAQLRVELRQHPLARRRLKQRRWRVAAEHACEIYVRPFWDAAVASDRRMLGETRTMPSSNRAALIHMAEQGVGWFVDRGIVPATRVDPVVFRGLLRIFHMLDAPEDLVRNPELVLRTLPVLARVLRGDAPPSLFQPTPRERVLAELDA